MSPHTSREDRCVATQGGPDTETDSPLVRGRPVRPFRREPARLLFGFETDLSQISTLPRRRRYGSQLAGLAVDSVVLAALEYVHSHR